MKKGLFLSLVCLGFGSLLFSYQGENATPGFVFPIDGGRKVMPVMNNQNGQEFAIGYLTVTSIDSEGALNNVQDQQNVNQLLNQVNQLYVQIYNQLNGNANSVPSNKGACPQNTPVPSGCSQRRIPKWR